MKLTPGLLLNPEITLADMRKAKTLLDTLNPRGKSYYYSKKVRAISCIAANARFAVEMLEAAKYSRDANKYSKLAERYGKDFYTYRIIVPLVDALVEDGFLHHLMGFNSYFKRMSRLWATEKLLEFLQGDYIYYLRIPDPIRLKDENKKLIDYEDTSKTKQMRKRVEAVNSMMNGVLVTLIIPESYELGESESYYIKKISFLAKKLKNKKPKVKTLGSFDSSVSSLNSSSSLVSPLLITDLYRVFNDNSFDLGGRFYNQCYQQCPKQLRQFICINNESTVELDYKGLHIRLLYHQKGVDYDGDPYDLFNGDMHKREICKFISIYVLNSDNKLSAERACWKNLAIDKKMMAATSESYQFIRDAIELMCSEHEPIKEHFFTHTSKRLQNLDSNIMETILGRFVEEEIPIMCIHDSCIVAGRHENLLREVMRDAYVHHVGFEPVLESV